MKNGTIALVIFVVAVVLAASIYYMVSQDNSTPANASNSNDNPPVNPETGGKLYQIDIQNFAFNPAALNVNVGDTIIWTNKDSAPHTITSESGSELDSPTLSNGQTYSHTFSSSGEFDYFCSIHPMMKGKIIVS